jgi:hypothetical protein
VGSAAAGELSRSSNPVTPAPAGSKLMTRRKVGTDPEARVRPAITSAFSPEAKITAAPQSLRTKATSSAVSITLIGLTTAPARKAAW